MKFLIEISAELIYVLIFFLIVVLVVFLFIFSGFSFEKINDNISNFFEGISKFVNKMFGEK